LAQQATISALQGLLIQSTLDHTNNEATLTALKSQLHANPAPTIKPAVGLPFDEKFADNHTGWDTIVVIYQAHTSDLWSEICPKMT
jgi:hypothetical protein